MDDTTIITAPTPVERELFKRAAAKFADLPKLRQSVLAAEMVALGVPTTERAVEVIEAIWGR